MKRMPVGSAEETEPQTDWNGTTDQVYGGPLRGKSTQFGAGVWLCGNRCHRLGPMAVHRSRETREILQDWMQRKLMQENHWTEEDFRKIFGKSYLRGD